MITHLGLLARSTVFQNGTATPASLCTRLGLIKDTHASLNYQVFFSCRSSITGGGCALKVGCPLRALSLAPADDKYLNVVLLSEV